jgi:hypothetical protein
MRSILHIQSDTTDARAEAAIAAQRALADVRVDVVDLRPGTPDYNALLDCIFAADAVAVW